MDIPLLRGSKTSITRCQASSTSGQTICASFLSDKTDSVIVITLYYVIFNAKILKNSFLLKNDYPKILICDDYINFHVWLRLVTVFAKRFFGGRTPVKYRTGCFFMENSDD